MKKILSIAVVLSFFLALIGCQKSAKYDVVTTMFPQYGLTKEIVGDKLSVKLLTPPGADAHSYEFSSKEIGIIDNSKLFLYTSDELDPQIKNLTLKKTNAINLKAALGAHEHEHEHKHETPEHEHEHETPAHEHAHEHTHEHGGEGHNHGDVHYWTAFEHLKIMADVIYDEIIKIDSDNKDFYLQNFEKLTAKIDSLKADLKAFIATSTNKTLFYVGHNAMDAFAEEFGLTITALVDDLKPDAEVTSTQFQTLIREVKEHGAKVLMIPELEPEKLANTIIRELKKDKIEVKVLELHGLHNITKEQFENNLSILTILEQNVNNVKEGLKNA